MTEQAQTTVKLYGVSFGNGNDGVSQLFPDYYVRTDDPWTLARAAVIDRPHGCKGKEWTADFVSVNGHDAEYTIQAVIYDPPGEYDSEGNPYGGSWCEANGAWLLCEVFPVSDEDAPDESDPWAKMVHASIDEALTAEAIALANKKNRW